MPIDRERALLERFVRDNGLRIEYVVAPSFGILFPMLEADKGDLISSNVSDTSARRKKYLLSEPTTYTREVVFTSEKSSITGSSPAAIIGITGWLLPDTSYVDNFRVFTKNMKNVSFKTLPVTVPHDELIESVSRGSIPYSILNESDLDAWLSYRKGIRKLFAIRENVPMVFAARRDSAELISHLNDMISSGIRTASAPAPVPAPVPQSVSKPRPVAQTPQPVLSEQNSRIPISKADLNAIKKRGFLRVLTSNDSFCCYIHRGQVCGFEYEMAKRFCDSIGVRIVTVIPTNFSDLIPWLNEGRGDVIAANFTASQERRTANPGLTFCAPYLGVTEILIGRPNENITKLAD